MIILRQSLTLMTFVFISIGFISGQNIDAKSDYSQFKSSVLLVRLQTKTKAINALKDKGHVDFAKEVERDLRLENLEIVKAFKDEFDYIPVYYFFSSDSKSVSDKKWDEVKFLNDSLEYDETIEPPASSFYTAEFGNAQGSGKLGFGAVIIKNSKFEELERPFPYYSRTFESVPWRRKKSVVVKKLNENIRLFFRATFY